MTIDVINRGKWERYYRDLSEFPEEERSMMKNLAFMRRIGDGVDFNDIRADFMTDETITVSATEDGDNFKVETVSGGGMPAWPDGRHLFTVHGWEGPIEPLVRYYIDGTTMEMHPLPEPPEPVPSFISDRQFFQQLAIEGTITNSEALAAVRTGEIPSVLAIIISGIEDESSKFAAEMMLSGATQIERNHPLTSTIAFATGRSEADIDNFFREASLL